MSEDVKQVALIGYGFAGKTFHAPFLVSTEGLKLTKVVSSAPQKVLADLPSVEVVGQPEAVFNDPDIDLVVLASPNLTHYPLAKAALQAGKHVVIDKPFVIHSPEAHELIRLAEENRRVLSVYQSRRWDGDFRTVKALLASNLLGDITYFESRYDRFRPEVKNRWREQDLPGSGILYDLGAHLIDQALQLFGSPRAITADLRQQRPGAQATDYFHLVLDYDALQVVLHSSCLVKQPGPHFQAHGSQGSFVKYGMDPQEAALIRGERPGPHNADWGRETPEWYGEMTTRVGELEISKARIETLPGDYPGYYRQLQASLTGQEPVPVLAADAAKNIELIEKAIISSREGRTIRLEA
ncbi:MAG: oxidoreductase [Chloroflexi bacterium]|jgi:scyllo-inositol 2-dehydrogenase (NADP+)|nr:oxidoreductase [Chloroflexota bacterium]